MRLCQHQPRPDSLAFWCTAIISHDIECPLLIVLHNEHTTLSNLTHFSHTFFCSSTIHQHLYVLNIDWLCWMFWCSGLLWPGHIPVACQCTSSLSEIDLVASIYSVHQYIQYDFNKLWQSSSSISLISIPSCLLVVVKEEATWNQINWQTKWNRSYILSSAYLTASHWLKWSLSNWT